MTTTGSNDAPAVVWAATWVPRPCPVEGFGAEAGYSVAWVQVANGPRLQVLVDGLDSPAPGTNGRVRTHDAAEQPIDVFIPDAGAST